MLYFSVDYNDMAIVLGLSGATMQNLVINSGKTNKS